MKTESELLLLHCSLIDSIGVATLHTLITHKPPTMEWADLYTLQVHQFQQIFGVSEKVGTALKNGLLQKDLLTKECALINQHNISWTTVLSDEYPPLLRHIHTPPPLIYWQGNLNILNAPTLAIVGSRKAHFYAQDIIDTFVPPLVQHGWTIVSGGALGVDSMAHNATLKAGGSTVAVLGSGLLHAYPQTHKKMFESIKETGLVLSSFGVNTVAYAHNFPLRNRIVSGLSKGCLVVQAAEKSGARITAQCALDQGRDVFAVPGSLKDPLSAGCHALIQQGAKLVTSAQDIMVEYESLEPLPRHYVQQTILDTQAQYTHDSPARQIMQLCIRPQSIEALCAATDCSLAELQTILFELQLEGTVKQDFSGLWSV